MSYLDEIDAQARRARRDRLDRFRLTVRTRDQRMRRILRDPKTTKEEKRQAKIVLGADWVDPYNMTASGGYGPLRYHGRQGMVEPSRKKTHVPLPPTHHTGVLDRLLGLLVRR